MTTHTTSRGLVIEVGPDDLRRLVADHVSKTHLHGAPVSPDQVRLSEEITDWSGDGTEVVATVQLGEAG
ncbi:MAG: hypothetical protein ACWA49_03490 [Ruegeria sp.]